MSRSPKSQYNLRPVLLCAGLIISIGTCSSCGNPRKSAASPLRTETIQAAAPSVRSVNEPTIRVAVLKDAPAARITGGSATRLLNSDGKLLQQFPDQIQLDAQAGATGMIINGVAVNDSILTLESSRSDAYLAVNGQDVAPRVVLRRGSGQSVTVVAHLDMEDYLHGVLAGEVPFERWHPEALRAQAITSRSYAYHQARVHSADPYDVESTVMSQVFKPGFRNNPILHTACESTRGLVLTCDNQTFPAYFHSTCGGATASAAGIFPDYASVKALRGTPCPYCTGSPHYRWRMTLRKDALAQKLRTQYPGIQTVSGLEFVDASGRAIGSGNTARATLVRVRHNGGTMQMQGNAFRLLVSPRDLKSLLIEEVSDKGDSFEIAGGGFGHGVGMCQFGSNGMAQSGRSYAEILGMYFPGAALTKAW